MERLKHLLFSSLLIFIVLLFIPSCSGTRVQKEPSKGVYHRVKNGETAWSIARAYRIKLEDLAEINDISDPNLLKEGSVVFIPGANQVIDDVMTYVRNLDAASKTAAKTDGSDKVKGSAEIINEEKGKSSSETKPVADKKIETPAVSSEIPQEAKIEQRDELKQADATPAIKLPGEKIESEPKVKPRAVENEQIKLEKKLFIWPVNGRVKTRFGIQPNKTFHNWIKIVSVAGSEVKAAASGNVIFSSKLKGYGQTIIVRHENNFTTVYTHLKKINVKADQNIKKGEKIALVGDIDKTGDAYINFEIRLQGKARNPLFFLP
ncbi:MAG: M23 family metallopeptidase [Smithellaceae bacterium]|jgi:lipoprotein NlpD